MASYDFDMDDDFEAQLAAMNADVDSQYSDFLSQASSTNNSNNNINTQEESQSNNLLNALSASVPANVHSNTINKDYSNAAAYNDDESLDHIQLSLTDIDSDAESDFGENESLTGSTPHSNTHKSSSHGHSHSGHDYHGDEGHGHSHGSKAPGHEGCGDDCDGKSELQRQLDEKFRLEELQLQQQWDDDMQQYRTDPTLSGFIFNHDIKGLKAALASGNHHVHELDFRGEHTALHHAVFHEEEEFIEEIMKHGCNVNVPNFRGETPLMLACKLEEGLQLIALLVEKYGADVHAKDNVGLHAFHHSAEKGRVYHLSLLHTIYGVDINVVDIYNKSALHWAAWAGHLQCCEWLLRHGCSPYTRDQVGCYPLHWAAAKSRDPVINLLANFDLTDGQNLGGLRTVADKTYWKQVRKLRYGDKLDYNNSPWVQSPDNIHFDPAIPEQSEFHKKADKSSLKKYNNDELYDDFTNASYNAMDYVTSIIPSQMPNYIPFPQQLLIKNKDGLDVKAFALFKNESLEGIDRYYINNTIKFLERYNRGWFWYTNSTFRWMNNQVARAAYLPIHFFMCYLFAIMASVFVVRPLFTLYFPSQVFLCWIFDIVWCFVMYNWYRIVFTTPARVDFFTPATKKTTTVGFGDDGSTTFVNDLPSLTDDVVTNSNNDDNDGYGTAVKGDSCTAVATGLCSVSACNEPNHKIPTQRFTVKEYQSISTLYTLYVDLMTSGKADSTNTCYTCEIARPLRSKHCPRCNRCVPRFDHHCPFFNQDIAYSNYHNFLWFLILVPTNYFILMYQFYQLSINGLVTVEHLPPAFFNFLSPVFSEGGAVLFFKIFIYHYIIYVIFDLMLFSQHIWLLKDGLTTNEAMNRQRYSYLAISGIQWNPFSRGGFLDNFIAGLGFHKFSREPLCMTDDQCKAIGYTKSPLTSSWANKLKSGGKKNKNTNRV